MGCKVIGDICHTGCGILAINHAVWILPCVLFKGSTRQIHQLYTFYHLLSILLEMFHLVYDTGCNYSMYIFCQCCFAMMHNNFLQSHLVLWSELAIMTKEYAPTSIAWAKKRYWLKQISALKLYKAKKGARWSNGQMHWPLCYQTLHGSDVLCHISKWMRLCGPHFDSYMKSPFSSG